MRLLKSIFFHSPIKHVILFILGCFIIVINGFTVGFDHLISYVDGTFVAGFSLILIGGLLLYQRITEKSNQQQQNKNKTQNKMRV